ncbi:unnamed protein product [Moneuplotes crassus]|uniref:Uncharacterized protein n=1 Tax=Euplotes crassus TaxID=5936 RepID=A0AAD1XTW7_EUPCR|nr:unnamed protein product [Moneuplotes crassus]
MEVEDLEVVKEREMECKRELDERQIEIIDVCGQKGMILNENSSRLCFFFKLNKRFYKISKLNQPLKCSIPVNFVIPKKRNKKALRLITEGIPVKFESMFLTGPTLMSKRKALDFLSIKITKTFSLLQRGLRLCHWSISPSVMKRVIASARSVETLEFFRCDISFEGLKIGKMIDTKIENIIFNCCYFQEENYNEMSVDTVECVFEQFQASSLIKSLCEITFKCFNDLSNDIEYLASLIPNLNRSETNLQDGFAKIILNPELLK